MKKRCNFNAFLYNIIYVFFKYKPKKVMTPQDYKHKLEKQLIKEFIDKFYTKIGYRPVVITEGGKDNDGSIILTLNELETYFKPFLAEIGNKKLSTKSRVRSLVELRHIFCAIARTMGYSYKYIGSFIGGKDHTTVIHGIRSFNNLYQTDERIKGIYLTILNNIKSKYYESPVMDDTDQA